MAQPLQQRKEEGAGEGGAGQQQQLQGMHEREDVMDGGDLEDAGQQQQQQQHELEDVMDGGQVGDGGARDREGVMGDGAEVEGVAGLHELEDSSDESMGPLGGEGEHAVARGHEAMTDDDEVVSGDQEEWGGEEEYGEERGRGRVMRSRMWVLGWEGGDWCLVWTARCV